MPFARSTEKRAATPDEIYYVDDILADDASLSSGTSYSWGTAYMGMNTLKAQAEGQIWRSHSGDPGYGQLTDRTSCSSPERSPRRATILSTPIKMYRIITDTARMWRALSRIQRRAMSPVPYIKDIEQQRIFLSADDQDGAAVCAEPQCFRRQYEPRFRGSQCHVHHLSGFPSSTGRTETGIAISCASGQQRSGCLLLLSGMQQQDSGSLLFRAE